MTEPENLRLPDFIIGGAPRSGTTWLCHALDRHPSVAMARPVTPEPKFFLVDETYAKGLAHYSRTWFQDIPGDLLAGEKSTNYLENPRAAERIARDLPGVRLIFVLREPVSRAYSNFLWSRMNGLEAEDFAAALDLEAERERSLPAKLRYARPHAYFSRGLYADLLQPWLALFPRENILLLPLDLLEASAGAFLARAHAFLGVAERPGDAEGLGLVNLAREEEGAVLPPEVRRRLEAAYAEPGRRLAELDPEFAHWVKA